jgi:hypothetical protein
MSRKGFEDESPVPPLDEDLLKALVRRELSPDEARDVYQLIYAFESWNLAHARILIANLPNTDQLKCDSGVESREHDSPP